MKKSLLQRMSCLMLSIVMTLSLLPSAAFAAQIDPNQKGQYSDLTSGTVPQGAYCIDKFEGDYFTRYSLVRLPRLHNFISTGDLETGWMKDYAVLGSFDISMGLSRGTASGVGRWYDTCAVGYADTLKINNGSGLSAYTNTVGSGAWANGSLGNIQTAADTNALWSGNHFVTDKEFNDFATSVLGLSGVNGTRLDIANKANAGKSLTGVLTYKQDDGTYAGTNTFFAVLAYLAADTVVRGKMPSNDDAWDGIENAVITHNWSDLTDYVGPDGFFFNLDDYEYRLVVETGFRMHNLGNSDSDHTQVLTVQDAAAHFMTGGGKAGAWPTDKSTEAYNLAQGVGSVIRELGYRNFIGKNEFSVYLETAGTNISEEYEEKTNAMIAPSVFEGGLPLMTLAPRIINDHLGYGVGVYSPYDLGVPVDTSNVFMIQKKFDGNMSNLGSKDVPVMLNIARGVYSDAANMLVANYDFDKNLVLYDTKGRSYEFVNGKCSVMLKASEDYQLSFKLQFDDPSARNYIASDLYFYMEEQYPPNPGFTDPDVYSMVCLYNPVCSSAPLRDGYKTFYKIADTTRYELSNVRDGVMLIKNVTDELLAKEPEVADREWWYAVRIGYYEADASGNLVWKAWDGKQMDDSGTPVNSVVQYDVPGLELVTRPDGSKYRPNKRNTSWVNQDGWVIDYTGSSVDDHRGVFGFSLKTKETALMYIPAWLTVDGDWTTSASAVNHNWTVDIYEVPTADYTTDDYTLYAELVDGLGRNVAPLTMSAAELKQAMSSSSGSTQMVVADGISEVHGFRVTAEGANGLVRAINDVPTTVVQDGNAHLIVDYNFPGIAASSDSQTGITAGTTVECGTHKVGDTVKFQLAGNFGGKNITLTPNTTAPVWTWSQSKSDSASDTDGNASGSATANANATVQVKFDGLWTAAQGGERVTYGVVNDADGKPTSESAWQYTLQHDDLTVLYAHWVVDGNLDLNVDIDVEDNGGGPGTGTGSHKSKLYTVYYDQAYDGGGITSALWGKFYVPVAMKAARWVDDPQFDDEGNYIGCDHHWEWDVGGQGDYWADLDAQWDISQTFEVSVEFTHPNDPVRLGWDFIGWTSESVWWPIDMYQDEFVFKSDNTYGDGASVNANIANAKAELARRNKASAYADMFESDGLTPKGVESTEPDWITYYAVWYAKPICWDANGGKFGAKFDTDGAAFLNTSRTVYRWPGCIYTQSYVPIVGGNGGYPEREGYEFDQWYFQPGCTIPLVEMVQGIQPNRNYFAGWIPQPVYVNYYDTREGTSLITTQEYKYDDFLNLLDTIKNTSGEHFVSWNVGSVNGQKMTTGTLLDSKVLTKHDTNKDDHQVDYQNYWTLDLYADYDHQTCDYTVTIDWDDYANNDGARPKEIKVGLIDSRGNAIIETAGIKGDSKADTWTHTFTDLDITTSDASTEKVTYSFCILEYTDALDQTYKVGDTGATSGEIRVLTQSDAGSTDAATTYTYALNRYTTDAQNGVYTNYSGRIYMNHNLILTGDDIKFTIQWDDDSNRDGVRPQAITLALYDENGNIVTRNDDSNLTGNSGTQSVSEAMCEVSADGNTWTYVFKDYQKYTNGGKLAGYSVGITTNVDVYTVKYLDGGANFDENGVVLTHVPETVAPVVSIEWDDEDDRDGTRVDSVDVRLNAYQWNDKTYRWETVEVDTMTLTEAGGWRMTHDRLPKNSGGREIIYKTEVISDLNANVVSDPSDDSVTNNGYTWTSQTTGNVSSVITVHHDINRVNVLATLEWDDNGNESKLRPSSVLFKLYALNSLMLEDYDTPVVTGDMTGDTWTYEFKDLPMNRAGHQGERINYVLFVDEIAKDELYGSYISTANGEQQRIRKYLPEYRMVEGGTTSVLAQSGYPFVRLTHDEDQCTINVYASWHDEQNRDGKRPTSLLIDLYKQVDGERTYMDTLTVTAGRDNSWTYTVRNLPMFENGKEILYVADVSEDFRTQLEESTGYTVAIQGLNVHLYYTPKMGFVTTQVHWDDNDDNDSIRPDAVTAQLFANGKAQGEAIELNSENGWTYTWSDLDSYFRDKNGVGQEVIYTVEVESVDGYSVTYVPAQTTTVRPETIYINLSHGGKTTSEKATITWNDNGNADSIRPEKLGIQLYANGEPVVGHKVFVTGEGNVWTHEFTDLPAYLNGKPVYYTVMVDDSVTGYQNMAAGMNVYMSHNVVTSNLRVSFRFDDNNNADGVRPDGGYLFLVADGKRVNNAEHNHTTYVGADGLVNDIFYSLPVYSTETGKKIQYNVEVEWDSDIFGGDETRYEVKTSTDVTLSEDTQNVNQLLISAKLKARKTMDQVGSIYWFDNNNQRGNRPDELTINVYDDIHAYRIGEYVLDSVSGHVYAKDDVAKADPVGTVTVNPWGLGGEASQWQYTIEGLLENAIYDGESHRVTYYAEAQSTGIIPWFTVIDGQRNGMNVNLTHINYVDDRPSATQDFRVNVNWLDNSNAWGYRPETAGVDLELAYETQSGLKGYRTVRLTRSNAMTDNADVWTYTFRNVPTYLEGNAVKWTARIVDGSNEWYTESLGTVAADYAVIKMTQTIGFDLTARWDDFDDNDHVRPESVSVNVYADGTLVGTVRLTGEGNAYTGSIKNLPVYREISMGMPVAYGFDWADETGSLLKSLTYEASATLNGEAVENNRGFYYLSAGNWGDGEDAGLSGSGMYQWETTLKRAKDVYESVSGTVRFDDAGDQDGIRPESVQVQLFGKLPSGETFEVGEPKTLQPENGRDEAEWFVSWDNLDVFKDGESIEYVMDLVGTVDGYAKTVNDGTRTVTLSHVPETVTVTAEFIFDDSSEAHYHYNSYGDLTSTTYGIERVPVMFTLMGDGVEQGLAIYVPDDGQETVDGIVTRTWTMPKYRDHGTAIKYDVNVASGELAGLLENGRFKMTESKSDYDMSFELYRDLFDVTGTVHHLYVGDEFLLENVPVTAYLYDAGTGKYVAVGNAMTDGNGRYEIKNVPQGTLIIRATYQYGDYSYAGSTGIILDRHDGVADLLVNRDAAIDADLYRYTVHGRAFLQTDRTDEASKSIVPDGSIALLYKMVNGNTQVEYVGMTQTKDGWYSFGGLESGSYVVNIVFEYNGGVYTYDNADAVADGLTFVISGADRQWPDIVKQVNSIVEPGPKPGTDPENPDVPDEPETACIVGGNVFFNENGVHTTEPVSGVDVYVYTEANVEVGHDVTGEDGRWSVEKLPVGKYVAVFSYQGNASRVLRFEITESDFELGEFEAAPQYFDKVVTQPTAIIRGVVLDEAGNRVQALVQILDAEGDVVDFAYADKNGFYEFTVTAGFTYTVRIQEVGVEYITHVAGDPDDEFTTLDYYIASGKAVVNGEAQANKTIAIYKQNEELDFDLLTWTLTDAEGNWSVKLLEAGNYQMMMQMEDGKAATHKFSVGYQEWEPQVIEQEDGNFTISGIEHFDGLILQNTTTGIVVRSETETTGDRYEFIDLKAGTYDLTLIQGLVEKHYYIDCPDTVVNVTWSSTISGEVMENGTPVLGSVVKLFDESGEQVSDEIVITDGKYGWTEVPAGTYEIRIEKPVAGSLMGQKTTEEDDSYGKSYPGGMTENAVWAWNMNANTVNGIVTDQNGNAIENATVVIRSKDDPALAFGGMTGPDGKFSVGVVDGSYTVDAMFEVDNVHIYHAIGTVDVTILGDDVDGLGLVIPRYVLSGKTVRDGDDAILTDVDVTLAYPDGTVIGEVQVDEDGKFEFTVWTDSYVVIGTMGDDTVRVNVTVDSDESVTLKLGSVMTLSGTVRDAEGNLVTDGIVHYTGPKSGTVYTNDEGVYSITLTAADFGRYTLYAEAAGASSDAKSVDVRTDTVLDLDLNPVASEDQLWTLGGIVTDNEGNRLANTIVTLAYGDDKTKTLVTSTNKDGAYRFQVEDGTYYLTAVYESENGYSYETNAETVAHVTGGDNKDVNLVIRLAHDFTVSVIDTNGDAVANADVTYSGASNGTVRTGESGIVSLKLAGGDYEFQASIGNRESSVAHVSIMQAGELTLVIDLVGLGTNEPEVEASDLTISGIVHDKDGNLIEGATVVLEKLVGEDGDESWTAWDETESDGDGYYEFTGLEDGRYRVSIEYTVTETVSGEVDYFDIRDYAVDSNGNPFVEAKVNLYDANGELYGTVYTDETGYFEFLHLEQGSYVVEVIPVNTSDNEEPTEDPDHAVRWPVDSEVSSMVIEGVAIDAAGRPVEGAIVRVVGDNGYDVSMMTDETGEYRFDVPSTGDYEVHITYPSSVIVNTGDYEPDGSDPNAPEVFDDGYSIFGIVTDTDGNLVEGATVTLSKDDVELDVKITAEDGAYRFDGLRPGTYVVTVEWHGETRVYQVTTDGDVIVEEPDEPVVPVDKIHLSGMVVTDHKRPLAGAVITITELDTGKSFQIESDADGRFATGELERGRYQLVAEFFHEKGSNLSDVVTSVRTQENVALVIVLSYVDDVNGDGKDETVFAGKDDEFDTPDDFYEADVGNDGVKDPVYAGEDGKPGTKDDWYPWDLGNGEDRVYVGDDTIPGTEDDWYPVDVDDDGKDETVFIGEDGTPATEDDWYEKDVDGDGDDEHVFVGEDTKAGTDDDWYLDDDGNKQLVGIWVRFKANGGTVNGEVEFAIRVSELTSLPTAVKTDNRFNGWFLALSGGNSLRLADIKAFDKTTIVYAQWTVNTPGGGNTGGGGGGSIGGGGNIGGGGGGGSIGGGGGTTITDPGTPLGDLVTVKFDSNGGSEVADIMVPAGEFITAPAAPVYKENGYKFLGWYTTGVEHRPFNFETEAVMEDMTLQAEWDYVGVKSVFNTDDHIAYIAGFPDGSVQPLADITRAEVAMIFYRLLRDEVREQYKTDENSFVDVAPDSWYVTAVSTLANMGVIAGRGNGIFDPTAKITRAEFATMAARIDRLDSGDVSFTDVGTNHWAYQYIISAATKGWVKGYEDGTFRPEQNITRSEVMALVNRMLDRNTLTVENMLEGMKVWPDNSNVNAWYYLDVQEATNAHGYVMHGIHEAWTELTDTVVTNH